MLYTVIFIEELEPGVLYMMPRLDPRCRVGGRVGGMCWAPAGCQVDHAAPAGTRNPCENGCRGRRAQYGILTQRCPQVGGTVRRSGSRWVSSGPCCRWQTGCMCCTCQAGLCWWHVQGRWHVLGWMCRVGGRVVQVADRLHVLGCQAGRVGGMCWAGCAG